MGDSNVEDLARQVHARLQLARQSLLSQMADKGLVAARGWRVTEELRHTVTGTEWIFRPVHLHEPAPEVEVRVCIDHSGRPL
jgi:hypothetical protein